MIYSILYIVMIFASSQAELQATNVGMFSTDYVVYFSYASTWKDIFALDFNSGDDIQLHINPRYENGCLLFDINVLVLNNLVANKWNTEERPNGFPFLPNEQTSIIVTPQESAYHIVGQAAGKTSLMTSLSGMDNLLPKLQNLKHRPVLTHVHPHQQEIYMLWVLDTK